MNISVVMPQLGLTMEEGTVSAWLKKTGEVVKKDEPIFSVTTDKVEMEVEAVADGTLGKIIVQAGDTVPVGTVLGYLESASDDVAAVGSERKSAESAVETGAPQHTLNLEAVSSPTTEGEKSFRNPREGRVSPRARRLAKELGVVIAGVKGSGDEGQIRRRGYSAGFAAGR